MFFRRLDMSIKMLVFEYRDTEHDFFGQNKFNNYDIKFFDFVLDEETIEEVSEDDLNQASVVSVFINSVLSKKVIDRFKNLRVIAMRSTGYDNVDKKACLQRNIALLNVQNYGETAVAEFTMGLITGVVRNIFKSVISVKEDIFKEVSFVGRDLEKLTLGVVGTGAIGAAVCRLAHAFGMKILAYDLVEKTELEEKYNVNFTTLDFLIRNSDVITLHVPYTGDNYHMFSKHEFDLMKQNSYFINVARGELVDTKYLKENLENGKILAAALDVVACKYNSDCEKLSDNMEKSSLECLTNSKIIRDLIRMPNVFVTPHIAYESQDAIDYILTKTFDGIQDFINGGSKNRVF